ncbi:hypothetical protein MIND_00762700 [Mycena indigotica]|uniref:Uncharacterized protein n=1 Tax=Mycena indigotica TaxID=2126181 RepID=A0A8H6W3W2_9AGAR|nr:uncharacterized protein MIND_00762700 [Mycena indigotica]KAF7301966.1 hypothetical protein MIND_00762700 [Mycena indigotica]
MSSNADYAAVRPLLEVYFDMLALESLVYGIYVALFGVTVASIGSKCSFNSNEDTQNNAFGIVSRRQLQLDSFGLHFAVVVMFAMSTIHLATKWSIVKTAFVLNGETPLSVATYLSSPRPSVEILEATVFATNTFFADSILASYLPIFVWRCWTIWGRDYRVVTIPALSTITGALLGYLSVAQEARFLLNKATAADAYVQFSNPYFYLSLSTTVLCTLLIVIRIVLLARGSFGQLRSYSGVIEMVVESAAMYSATLIAFIAMGSLNVADGYPQAILGPMTGIAPTLIVARVSLGLSRAEPSWKSRGTVSADTMRFTPQVSLSMAGSAQPSDTIFSLSTLDERHGKV